jgi:rRNA maturation endonuclease Nob1
MARKITAPLYACSLCGTVYAWQPTACKACGSTSVDLLIKVEGTEED